MKEKNAEISARVAEMLALLHTNPNKFANALGYGRAQTIYDILEGKSAPSYDFFKRFLMSGYSVFINLRWLITGEGTPIIEETYYESDLPIVKGEMTSAEAKQKLEDIRAKKGVANTKGIIPSERQTNDLLNHLEKQLTTKDEQIWNLHEDIGRLKARIEMLEEQINSSQIHTHKDAGPEYAENFNRKELSTI